MRVIIIEDEDLAAWGLLSKLPRVDPSIEVVATLDSVKSAVGWLQANPMPDLAFFDVQLADGLSFEIFEQVKVTCPVIFTTAYDAYALKAFKVNSVDYLLKPVSQDDLAQAFAKLRTLRGAPLLDAGLLREMMETIRPNRFKTRFMVKIGDQLSSIDTRDVEYFFGENKVVWLRHHNGRKYVIDYTLEQLEDLLDPTLFFRINRQYISTLNAIKSATTYSNSRLKVTLKAPLNDEDILISREKVDAFKEWMGK
ncbi:MAG: response regulator transcription factor [Saprospiraceae bacterium]|nr:response regulator transcription factor [Saprospiraceae bacterium]